ncbi:MAG: HAD hydrolase-like protein [Gemmatimonadetes bacterium]|nr:HAD hydrolase-like protein [Gemmatimonadota bacterium]NNM04095.1 HAD hydrolase-like protein [Gemmatimonadota bacterium]
MRRLLLFDIDGTLVWGGPAKTAFELAMESVFGTAGPIQDHDFSGKTDPQIARELLQLEGLPDEEIEAGFGPLWEEYLGELKVRLVGNPMTVLPGVVTLLDHLDGMDDVALGLLTGNIVEGARLKLGSVGLLDYFRVGGYGSDSEMREDLPAVAIQRACEAWDRSFPSSSVVVVGDTPRDVACGKHGGTRTVAVATGRHGIERLAAEEPDRVLADLRDLEQSLAALLA